jgi:uncharacterized MAPEG superfamily protein
MTIELTMLAYCVALFLVLLLVQGTIGVLSFGLPYAAGARDDPPAPSALHARATRVVQNHVEGLVLFAPIVLIAAVIGAESPNTALGAQIYFYARVAHAITYFAGIAYVRTLAWVVGLVGAGMVFLALFGAA